MDSSSIFMANLGLTTLVREIREFFFLLGNSSSICVACGILNN